MDKFADNSHRMGQGSDFLLQCSVKSNMERRFAPHTSIQQHRSRRESYTTDDEDPLGRMSDLEGDTHARPTDYVPLLRRRRSSSVSLAASPSSSSQKMSIDSDDGRSVSSISAGGGSTSGSRLSSFLRQPYIFPPDMPPPLLPRRLTRSLSSELSWSPSSRPPPQPEFGIDEIMVDPSTCTTSPAESSTSNRKLNLPQRPGVLRRSSSAERIPHHRHHRSASSSSAEASGSHSPVRRSDPERRSVTRRSSLFPRSKALARVINQTDEETRLADVEMRREHDMTQQIKARLGKMSMDTESASGSSSSKAIASGSVPAVAWARIRDVDSSPTMAPYHASKLNPEMEMTNFQFDNLPSPMHQSYKSIKRKASEDRFEPYPTNSLKRRAVSPSVSASGSPVLSAISSPPYSFYGSSPTSNAAARAQQKPGQLSSFNLQDASGGLSRMSLSE
ncbi:hypothetical protein BJV82DRAFT_615403 [Fennellomyces sp. T-0311]|nr:hypothetical protein BJV82DRAFT_615403 [Fennellomyces sp. T-0311]